MFVAAALTAYLVADLASAAKPETAPERLQRLVAERQGYQNLQTRALPGAPLAPLDEEEQAPRKSVKQKLVEAVEQATEGKAFSEQLEARLLRAGWRLRPGEFLMFQAMAAAGGLILSVVALQSLWWALTPLGWFMPVIMLGRAERARVKLFESQLPDALALMSNSLRSGYSFLQAMDVVSREMPDPIAKEFGQVLREIRVNIPVEEAVTGLTKRVKSADVDLMVTAILIQRQIGGNLSEILETIGSTIRDRIKMLGQIRTLTTQGRLSGWIVCLLPIALAGAFYLINPSYITLLFTHPLGWMLLGLAVVMQGIGVMVIRNMVNLEV